MDSRAVHYYHLRNIDQSAEFRELSPDLQQSLKVAAAVLPFRVNNYVLEELIDWDTVPDDPIYRLVFPQKEMLDGADVAELEKAIASEDHQTVQSIANRLRMSMNPIPSSQMDNRPVLFGETLKGIQHKYKQTALFFPSRGQICYSYCSYCFRWAQFVGPEELRFADNDATWLTTYLGEHPEVSEVILTGGDPMTMKTKVLERYLAPLLQPELAHVTTIRIGTKAAAFWPYRFTSDDDADDLLRLLERVVDAGKHLAIMTHYSHPRELSTQVAREAIRRIRGTGAVVRSQEPVMGRVNDDAPTWAELWSAEVTNGIIPYYMFVERNTGAHPYFKTPLHKALEIHKSATRIVSGLGRTARGPVMSCSPGKILIEDTANVQGEDVFVLRFLRARDESWVGRVFFARFDAKATWFDDLDPASEQDSHFFDPSPARRE